MGPLTVPLGLGFVGIQYRDAPGLSSTLGWVQNSNLNLGLEVDTGLGTVSPRVISYSGLGAWAGTWRGWRWSWVGGTGRGSWAAGRAVACRMNCGVAMAGGGDGTVSGCCGFMAGGAYGSGSLAPGSTGAGCSSASCAFCSCRCHRERWQQSG